MPLISLYYLDVYEFIFRRLSNNKKVFWMFYQVSASDWFRKGISIPGRWFSLKA